MIAFVVCAPFASSQPIGSTPLPGQGCFFASEVTSAATQRHLPVRRWRFFTPARSSSVTDSTRFSRFLTSASRKYGSCTGAFSALAMSVGSCPQGSVFILVPVITYSRAYSFHRVLYLYKMQNGRALGGARVCNTDLE